jgi:hypothetical protein
MACPPRAVRQSSRSIRIAGSSVIALVAVACSNAGNETGIPSDPGALAVRVGEHNPSATDVCTDRYVSALQIAVSETDGTDVTVTSVKLGIGGTVDPAADLTRALLVEDADGDGTYGFADEPLGSGTYSAGSGSIVITGLQVTVTADTTRNWLVVLQLAGSAANGATVKPRLAIGATSQGQQLVSGGQTATGNPMRLVSLAGRTWYVDDEGDDSADGRSPGTAFETLPHAIAQ